MNNRMTSALIGFACTCLVGCSDETREIICDGLQAGATEVVAALFTALFQCIGGNG